MLILSRQVNVVGGAGFRFARKGEYGIPQYARSPNGSCLFRYDKWTLSIGSAMLP